MPRIAIMGTGRMGSGLGAGWARAGHAVVYGARTPAARQAVGQQAGGAAVTDYRQALAGAEVVVLALPFAEVAPFAREHAVALRGPVIVDISNPFAKLPDNRTAGAELTAEAIGEGAQVAAAFKANFARTLAEPVDPATGLQRDVQFATDSEAARAMLQRLIADLGFRPLDCGALRNARILDGMVALMLELDSRYHSGGAVAAWKLLPGK